MTSFEIERLDFKPDVVGGMDGLHERFQDWPVVYTIDDTKKVYIGESQHVSRRMSQHLSNPEKQGLRTVRVVVDNTFNRSACHDLESTLIRWFSGDQQLKVLNKNIGLTNASYYRREDYQKTFEKIFDALRAEGLFRSSIQEIENNDLFKLSPYKALNPEQDFVIEAIMDGLVEDLEAQRKSLSIVQGDPGTGKTVVGIYLLKLLCDIAEHEGEEDESLNSPFSDYFVDGTRQLFKDLRIGIVVPQGSLRSSISKVIKKTPALRNVEVLNAFKVGDSSEHWDILVVDEAHRLTQYAAQSTGALVARYREISKRLFGAPLDKDKNQLDWIRAQAKHTILLLDTEQAVRPADIETEAFTGAIDEARRDSRLFRLHSQMRVAGGNDYIRFVRELLSNEPPSAVPHFGDYDFRVFTDLPEMISELKKREQEVQLSRLVAGYAWDWVSRHDKDKIDISIGDVSLRWNSVKNDWINSSNAVNEVGSIHTVQGYDLNYTGVIIGGDLRRDPESGKLWVDEENYRDPAGKQDNNLRERITTSEDLLRYIRNVYAVLMTRGMRGTYVYATDPGVLELS